MREKSRDMIGYGLALITQDRRLEKIMRRISNHLGYELSVYENCADFVKDFVGDEWGVVVIDGYICSEPYLMDFQMVFDEAPAWQAIYLPSTNKKQEIEEAMAIGAFGCLHRPVSEQEIRQMVQSAMGM
jgi:FixJ family two-component response regulator